MIKREDRKDLRLSAATKAFQSFVESAHDVSTKTPSPERLNNFIARENLRKFAARRPIEVQPLERMVGTTLDFKDFPPNELARRKGRPVARIHEISEGIEPIGFGTGFLVAPNILITNYHVFPTKDFAVNCAANFLHEKDYSNRTLQGVTYLINPDKFFYSFEMLDFALVFVESNPIDMGNDIGDLGCLPLIATKGKIIEGNPVSIIQYPLGEHKKYAYEENTITAIDDAQGIIQYTTDTLQGSSGSPVMNTNFEVVALHYTGVPSIVDGQWRTKTGKVWDPSMPEDEVLWIANAGKSISKIIAHLKAQAFPENAKRFINAVLRNSIDPILTMTPSEMTAATTQSSTNNIGNTSFIASNMSTQDRIVLNFNGPTNVYINQGPPVGQSAASSIVQVSQPPAAEAKLRFDEVYSARKGYNANFLQGFKVPMPKVSPQREDELYKAFGATVPFLLKYHHYSLVMNKDRRFQMWSAANVNYSESVRDSRAREDFGNDSTSWRLDKRIPAQYQVQADEFYDPATKVDKGHMVRRDDNCWEVDADALGIEYANSDSFHWTNCTPQHELFNRDAFGVKGLWGILENEIKKQLNDANNPDLDYGQKCCVLAGPVLDNANDPEYNGVQYPLEFWKVFAIRSQSEGNLVYGFLLSQKDKVDEFGLEGLPRFNVTVKALQVSLEKIEERSGVIFDSTLHQFDVMKDQPVVPLESNMRNFVRSRESPDGNRRKRRTE